MRQDLQEAITHYLEGTATSREQQMVNDWYYTFNDELIEIPVEDQAFREQVRDRIHLRLQGTIRQERPRGMRRFSMAAAILLLAGLAGGLWLYKRPSRPAPLATGITQAGPVLPGGNRAVLMLANGDSILLEDAGNGLLGQQGSTKIVKLNNGRVSYLSEGSDGNVALYNTIRTPRGGQYEITLPDGTRVWLNSTSTLRFPTVFNDDTREVSLEGEGYFEVTAVRGSSGARQPFIVHVRSGKKNMQIKVLGTKFNVMAYEEEPSMHAALLEGVIIADNGIDSVKVSPGQQASLAQGQVRFKTGPANFRDILAWKNGEFRFRETGIRDIMRQLCRWYDVKIEYRDNPDQVKLSGIIPKTKDISELLDALQATGKVNFEINNRTIIVHTKP